MKNLKIKLFRRTYRLFRRYVRVSHSEFHTETTRLEAKAQFKAFYHFLEDSGLEQEYLDWRAQFTESEGAA